jgi:hypothetical protein
VPAVPIPAVLPPGTPDQGGRLGAALTEAMAALFTAGALTDLTPFLSAAGPAASEGTLASRPVTSSVPRMRCAAEAGPSGPAPGGAMCGAGGGKPRFVR